MSIVRRNFSSGHGSFFFGTLAELAANARVYQKHDIVIPTDAPNQVYHGDGTNAFSGLMPIENAVKHRTASAINATATATAAQVKTGYITSTSAAAVGLTTPSATALATALGAKAGTQFEFMVDNVGGASAVTVILGAGITDKATSLVVASGVAGIFKLVFTSTTAAYIIRIALA